VSGFSLNGACIVNNSVTVTVLKDPNLSNFGKIKDFFLTDFILSRHQ
jgi:hypothetical protein